MKGEIDHQFEAEGMIGDTGNRITTSFEGGAQ
jgi:hypothetical protein